MARRVDGRTRRAYLCCLKSVRICSKTFTQIVITIQNEVQPRIQRHPGLDHSDESDLLFVEKTNAETQEYYYNDKSFLLFMIYAWAAGYRREELMEYTRIRLPKYASLFDEIYASPLAEDIARANGERVSENDIHAMLTIIDKHWGLRCLFIFHNGRRRTLPPDLENLQIRTSIKPLQTCFNFD